MKRLSSKNLRFLLVALFGFSILVSLYSQSGKITEGDIILDEDPLYNLKKNSEPGEKVKEEYEDTEFELDKQEVLQKKQNLKFEYNNETLQKFDSDRMPGKESATRKNKIYLYGGDGKFFGGGFEYGKDFLPTSDDDGYAFSGLNIKFKGEGYDHVQYQRNRISDSHRKFYDLNLNSFTLLSEKARITNKIVVKNIGIGLQNKSLYESQERISAYYSALFEFDQTKEFRHKASFKFLNIGFENNDSSLRTLNTFKGKTSDLQKFDLGYETSYRLFPFLEGKALFDFGQSLNKSTIYSTLRSTSVKSVNDEARFRPGLEKPADSDFLRDINFRAFLDLHHFSREKNFLGGELFLSYKWHDLEFGAVHLQRGYILNYADYYLANDLGDLLINVKRTKETKNYSFLKFETVENISAILKAGNSADYNRYVWSKGSDGLYLPDGKNLHYRFGDFDVRVSFLKIFQVGAQSEFRNYDEKKTQYLPDYVQSLYGVMQYGKYKLDVRSVYRGRRFTDNQNKTLAKDHRLDLLFIYSWKEWFEFRAEIRNIQGKELYYREDFLQPGRQILFGMGMSF